MLSQKDYLEPYHIPKDQNDIQVQLETLGTHQSFYIIKRVQIYGSVFRSGS
jgi:hypothetical protein